MAVAQWDNVLYVVKEAVRGDVASRPIELRHLKATYASWDLERVAVLSKSVPILAVGV